MTTETNETLVKLPYSIHQWEERAKTRHVLYHESGVIFEWLSIDPDKTSRNGAWTYCLSYQVDRVDLFGLGSYGSNIRINDPSELDQKIEEFIKDENGKTLRAREVAKLGTRSFEHGQIWIIRFIASGVFHHGTYFKSLNDVETYLKEMVNNEREVEAKVYSLDYDGEPTDYFGSYEIKWDNGQKKILFTKQVTEEI